GRPASWASRSPLLGLTLEDVDAYRNDERAERARPETLEKLDRALGQLDELAARTRMSRKLRKLQTPDEVFFHWWREGGQRDGTEPMVRRPGGVYEHRIKKVSQSVDFDIRASGYASPPLR